jgi:hypothetical protein
VVKTGHSISTVITANKGKENASSANKTKQVEPLDGA